MLKKQRGQFFTTNIDVHTVMLRLLETQRGRVLEPSAGAGDLVSLLEQRTALVIDAVEIDTTLEQHCKTAVQHEDFFVFSQGRENSYDAVFGNPPYVAWKGLEDETKQSSASVKERYTEKTNLYHLFIDRCLDLMKPGGEMILIVPKEWLYTSSAAPLRDKMMRLGSITHFVDCGEEKLFPDADVPALLIYRYVKGESSSSPVRFYASIEAAVNDEWDERYLYRLNQRLLLLPRLLGEEIASWGTLSDSYRVHVGYVTGADKIFRLPDDIEIEPSGKRQYLTTRGIEWFIDVQHVERWSDMPPLTAKYLTQYKDELLARRIAAFDESNWWRYGAIRNKPAMESDKERFYCYVKTRSTKPFFAVPEAKLFSGGVMGLFRADSTDIEVDTAVRILNTPAYRRILEAMFLTTGNKVVLQPATLEQAPFPRNQREAVAWLEANE